MDTSKRMKMVRMIDKMEQNKKYAEKLGVRNKSVLFFGEAAKKK